MGRLLGERMRAGDVLLLRGDLGSGKTTFVQGLVAGLQHPDPREVASPSYALHHRYEGGRLPVDHLDLYRVQGEELLRTQGVLDTLDSPEGVTVVEWSERLEAPPPGLVVDAFFTFVEPEVRRLELAFHGSRGRSLARGLAAAGRGDR